MLVLGAGVFVCYHYLVVIIVYKLLNLFAFDFPFVFFLGVFAMSSGILPRITDPSLFQSLYHHSHSYSLTFPPNSRWTKQSFKDECDINTIMSRYQSTGEMPDLALVAPQYLDATGMDFQNMQNKLLEAQALFDALPSKVRNRFANDPGEFLAFVSDPINHPELKSLGLLNETWTPADSGSGAAGNEAADKRSASVSAETA